jgi:hypothetical protein
MGRKHLHNFVGKDFGGLDLLRFMCGDHELLIEYKQYPDDSVMVRIVHVARDVLNQIEEELNKLVCHAGYGWLAYQVAETVGEPH